CRRQAGAHGRRTRDRRQASPGPGGVPGLRVDAVWVLHSGHDRVRGRPAGIEAGLYAGRHRPRHERQHLPLRDLHANHRCHRTGREVDEGRCAMNGLLPSDFEVERYELYDWLEHMETTRRDFFRIAGGGLIIGLLLGDDVLAQRPGGRGGGGPAEIGAWIHIGEDSAITVYSGKVEIGQNIRTSLSQVVADELHVPVSDIKMVMADTALVPNEGGTAGSRTTPATASQLRRAAAAAREALIDMAAEKARV